MKYGEYVRTKNGQISKNNSNYDWDLSETYINDSPVVNHSKNIIDLIQVGDYVNGCKVLYKVANMYLMVSTSDFSNNKIFNYMIKSILTKEIYEQNCFKVVE